MGSVNCRLMVDKHLHCASTRHLIEMVANIKDKMMTHLTSTIKHIYDVTTDWKESPRNKRSWWSSGWSGFTGLAEKSDLGIRPDIATASADIARHSSRLNLIPRCRAMTGAASAMYMACQAAGVKRSLTDISIAAGVDVVKVIECYQAMLPQADELFPADFPLAIGLDELPQL